MYMLMSYTIIITMNIHVRICTVYVYMCFVYCNIILRICTYVRILCIPLLSIHNTYVLNSTCWCTVCVVYSNISTYVSYVYYIHHYCQCIIYICIYVCVCSSCLICSVHLLLCMHCRLGHIFCWLWCSPGE